MKKKKKITYKDEKQKKRSFAMYIIIFNGLLHKFLTLSAPFLVLLKYDMIYSINCNEKHINLMILKYSLGNQIL